MKSINSLFHKVFRHVLSIFISLFLTKRNKDVFDKNYAEAKELYQEKISSYQYDKFLMPEWGEVTKTIEKYFLDSFSPSFLRHPDLKGTMFAHLPKAATALQKKLILEYFGEEKAEKYLKEDCTGSPILNDFQFKTSGNCIHHLYHLAKLGKELKIDIKKINSYVELGGGYGNMAKLIKRINNNATYTIIDIPIFVYIQYVYLSTILGKDEVVIYDGTQGIVPNKINLIPLDEELIKKFIQSNYSPDLFLSTWALSESNMATQELIRNNDYFKAKYILLAYQKANEAFRFAQNVTSVGNSYSVQYNETTEYLPNNFYLFANRKFSSDKEVACTCY